LLMVLLLVVAAAVDIYRLQETRNWAYRAAEAAALSGATLGQDLSTVYTAGQPRMDPATSAYEAEQTLLDTLSRHNTTGATHQIEVLEWGGTISNYPPVSRADLWGATDWTATEPSVGVYLEVPVETHLLGLALGGGPVTVHAFAAASLAAE